MMTSSSCLGRPAVSRDSVLGNISLMCGGGFPFSGWLGAAAADADADSASALGRVLLVVGPAAASASVIVGAGRNADVAVVSLFSIQAKTIGPAEGYVAYDLPLQIE